MSWCNDNWYESHLYKDALFGMYVLQPKKLIGCYDEPEASTQGFIVSIVMYSLLVFIGLVAYRSMNRHVLDFYRLFAIYSIFTIAVPLSLALSPFFSHSGFNRSAGLGILIHNLAEFFIVGSVWFGAVHTDALATVMYVWAFCICECFLPLPILFYIGMFQGALLDLILCGTFFHIMNYAMNQKSKYLKKNHRLRLLRMGFYAAMLHISSIIPLFFNFSTLGPFTVITIIFLAPTFILYLWFASVDKTAAPNLLRPTGQFGGVYHTTEKELLQAVQLRQALTMGPQVFEAHLPSLSNELEKILLANAYNDIHVPIDDDDPANAPGLDGGSGYNSHTNQSNLVAEKSTTIMPESMIKDINKEFNFFMLLNKGFVNLDDDAWSYFWRTFWVAFAFDLVFTTLVFFAPCYFDSSDYICDK